MSHLKQASEMRPIGFLVFPVGCDSGVKGWLVWLLGAGRCNGVRPFFLGCIGLARLFRVAQDDFLYAFVFDVAGWRLEEAGIGRFDAQVLECHQSRANFDLVWDNA